MDLAQGFPIDMPGVIIPWSANYDLLRKLIPTEDLHKVADGYYTTTAVVFGVKTMVGFHFKIASDRRRHELDQIELFDPAEGDIEKRYRRYQSALLKEFGPPTQVLEGNKLPESCEWRVDGFRIVHFAQYRFGSESHLRIMREGSSCPYDPFSRVSR